MSLLPARFVMPPHMGYILLDRALIIVEFSENLLEFAISPAELKRGELVSEAFPELFGVEDILEDIYLGERREYELREVARDNIYFNLYVHRLENQLLLLLENTTETMILKQSLVQRANETGLLLDALRNSKDYLDKVMLSMGDALIITDHQGKIRQVNQAAEEMFGFSETELLELSLANLVPHQVWQDTLHPQAIANHIDHIKNVEVACVTRLQHPLTLEFNCSQVLTDLDQTASYVYIGRNITARKQAELEQQRAIAKEREFVELRARFLSTASHEFRNPIASILMCAEILQDPNEKPTSEELAMYLDFIQQAGRNLKDVLEDVLLISRAESGKVKFQPGPLNLQRFCDQLIQQIHFSMNEQRIEATYDLSLEAVSVDGKLLQHILQNLLSNALKYSPGDRPVEFSISPGTPEGYLKFIVRDHGIGIPEADLQHIFDSFHRAKNVGEIPGTGLGMAITYEYIQIHHGTITIRSEENQGTEIELHLPDMGQVSETVVPATLS